MKRLLRRMVLAAALTGMLPIPCFAQQLLIPVGEAIGLHLQDGTVTVVAFDDTLGGPARNAGLQIGDQLLEIQGKPIRRASDVRTALQEAPEEVSLTLARGSRRRTIHMTPGSDAAGPRLGVYLRQGVSGIGTVTWYDPDSKRFGALGHGVSGPQGMLTAMTEGNIYEAEISSIVPGKSGQPGLLKGNASSQIGTLYRNTPQGVFGKNRQGWLGEPLPIASFEEIHQGAAAIRSTVDGGSPREYCVEILKIYPEDRQDCRNFLIKVTDPDLLTATGGIVQGMSGSPIIQDGRLIGAVTHVMVSDPTTGYGIFIGNMLDAAA